jgi:glutamine synthetase
MRESHYLLNPNKLVRYLKKPATQFTGRDIIRFLEENGIEMLHFRYVGGDGRLKTLNFVIQGRDHLEALFSTGERADGSSLSSYRSSDSSDLYIIPRFKTAFVNPFSDIPAIDILCSFYTREGRPLESARELYVDVDIFKDEHKSKLERLERVPTSCWESAECLEGKRGFFENHNVFPSGMIDMITKNLKSYNDRGLNQRLEGKDEEIRNLVDRFLHCG